MRLILFFISFVLGWGLTLDEAVELAIKNNTSVRLSTIELQKAEENIRKARAGILPRVGLSYSYTRFGGELAFGFTPKNRHSYLLNIEQTVFNRAVFEGISLAREQKELQNLILEDVLREVKFQTKQLFYALLYKKELVNIAQENLKYWEENYRQTEAKFKAGIIPKVELMRSKAQLESARANLENVTTDYKKSIEDFKKFLRYKGELEVQGKLEQASLADEDYRKLLENNSTIKVARKNLEVLRKIVEVQKAQYYPSINLFVTYQGNTARVGGSESMLEGYTFGARLDYSFFDGFAREASIAQARLDVLKQEEILRDTELSQSVELSKTLLDINSLKSQLRASELSLEAARESLRLSTERYRAGVATQLEVLDAVNDYNNILQNHYLLLYLYNTNIAKLERLTR